MISFRSSQSTDLEDILDGSEAWTLPLPSGEGLARVLVRDQVPLHRPGLGAAVTDLICGTGRMDFTFIF